MTPSCVCMFTEFVCMCAHMFSRSLWECIQSRLYAPVCCCVWRTYLWLYFPAACAGLWSWVWVMRVWSDSHPSFLVFTPVLSLLTRCSWSVSAPLYSQVVNKTTLFIFPNMSWMYRSLISWTLPQGSCLSHFVVDSSDLSTDLESNTLKVDRSAMNSFHDVRSAPAK